MYITNGFITKDRYYNGLWENLTPEQKKRTFFVPTFAGIPIKQYYKVFKNLRLNNRNFLIKEDYLRFTDIIYSLKYFQRIFKLDINPVRVFDIDISPLIKEELRLLNGFSNSISALLNYRFARRLKDEKIKLKLVIDWFENQVVDKGWNLGFNEYHPDATTIGYMGYSPPDKYLCSFPTKTEQENKLIPSVIGVTGFNFVDIVKEFNHDLKVEVAPAFRFNQLCSGKRYTHSNNYKIIFVALPGDLKQSIYILNNLKDLPLTFNNSRYRFWIKPHPIVPIDVLKKKMKNYWPNWPNEFEFTNDNVSELINKIDLTITGMSSICLESIALGIPVVVITNRYGITYNMMPKNIPQILWKRCINNKEICDAIKYYLESNDDLISNHQKFSKEIRKNHFKNVTTKTVNDFLMISKRI